MVCGIYKLNFKGTDKVYIGKSKDIHYRFIKHKYDLRSGKHSDKLLNAYTLYGMPELEIIYECNIDELTEVEAEAINVFDSIKNGFNTIAASPGINPTDMFGEDSAYSIYTNNQIREVMDYLINFPELTYDTIEKLTGVNRSSISMLASGKQHKWLESIYGENYIRIINNKREYIKQHPQIDNIIKFIRLSNEMLSSTIGELALISDLTIDVARNVCAGRTASKLLSELIPEEYSIFMQLKNTRSISTSKTTAKAKGLILPSIINTNTGEVVSNIENIAEFSRKRGLTASAIGAVLKGNRDSHKGWIVLK